MRTSSIVLVSIAGFGLALWLARGGAPSSHAATNTPERAGEPAAASSRPWAAASAPSSSAAAAAPKLSPQSERFRNRVDDQIPARLYGEASHCYKGGLKRDQRLDLTYHLHVREGAVSINNVRVGDSTLGDAGLERCIQGTIAAASWRDEQLPDLDEDGDLYMQVAGFSAYLANAEDDDSTGGGATN